MDEKRFKNYKIRGKDIFYRAMDMTECTSQTGYIPEEWRKRPDLMLQAMLIGAIGDLAECIKKNNE